MANKNGVLPFNDHFQEREPEHGPPPMGDEPQIGQSFVSVEANPEKGWGDELVQIAEVIGHSLRDEDGKPTSWIVQFVDADSDTGFSRTEIVRKGSRWVRGEPDE